MDTSKEVSLTLSKSQAFTLRLILDSIGGHPNTLRKHADEINEMLINQGIPYSNNHEDYIAPDKRSIYFIA